MTIATLKRGFWIVGGTLALIGLVGWYDRLAHGHVHANYGSVVTWGLWVAVYIYFIGLSAGSFLISSLVYVFNIKAFERIGRLALFTAVVTLFLALLSIWVDLGHMGRAWKVMAYPNFKSPMAWMIWLYSAYFTVLLIELWCLLRADLIRGAAAPGWRGRVHRFLTFGSRDLSAESLRRDRRWVKLLATIGVPLAIMFHGGVGALFGVVAARPHWHTGMFPILFLLSALVSGGALLMVVTAIFQRGWEENREVVIALGRLVLPLLLLDVLFQVSELLVAFRGGIPGHVEGMKLVLAGPFWWVFWAWQIGIGTLIPVALLASARTRFDARWVSLAGLLIAVGFFSVRLNIVIPGQAMEEVGGLTRAITSPRITTHYFPSLTEWLLSVGIVGIGLLLFGLGEQLLPPEHGEVEHVRL
jgi:molybdopterin-containing oxidoreductase family membrane subunit